MMRQVCLVCAALLRLSTGAAVAQEGSRSSDVTSVDLDAPRLEFDIADSGAPLLRQLVSLDLRDVSFGDALKELSRQLGGRLMYDYTVSSLDRRVTLRRAELNAGEALSEILDGTDLGVVIPEDGSVVLLKHLPPELVIQDSVTVSGSVVDADSREPIGQVIVVVDGISERAVTDANGEFTLDGIPVGEQVLRFHRIGYERTMVNLTLVADQDTSIVVPMTVVPVSLNELVATGTGERRRLEIGNSTVSIDVDSIMDVTPVSTVSQLLANRIPGLLATTNSGAVGSPTRLRMRGISSVLSDNEPIIIVDGVRFANTATTAVTNSLTQGVIGGIITACSDSDCAAQQPGANDLARRLDDLDPNMIASIEVMKGPAASTMYGSEAGNGVIIIKTKRGQAGPARWSFRADYHQLAQPRSYDFPVEQEGYRINGGRTITQSCSLHDQFQGTCIPLEGQVRGFNMLEDPRFSPVARGHTSSFGLDVSGGVAGLQYFIGGTYLDQLGAAKMPDVNRVWIENARGESLREETLRPNARTNASINARLTGEIGSTADFSIGTSVSSMSQRVGNSGVSGLLGTPRLPSDTTPVDGWDRWYATREQNVTNIVGNVAGNWRPTWRDNAFALNLNYGWNLSLKNDEYLAPKGSCEPLCLESNEQGILGFVSTGRRTNVTHSLDLGASFRLPVTSWLTTDTRLGGNYVKTDWNELYGSADDLGLGRGLWRPSGTMRINERGDSRATAGWYFEEQFNLRQDRLFMTLGLRQDAGSALGKTVKPVYPKWNLSWLASEEPFFPFRRFVSLFRLRFAFGNAGVMPASTAGNRTYAVGSDAVLDDGETTTGIYAELGSPGTPELKPERSREYEGGFDLEFMDGRLALDFTWFKKFTWDAIYRTPLAGSVGSGVTSVFLNNLGDVENDGFEFGAMVRVLDTPRLSYSVTANLTSRRNELVRLGEGVVPFREVGAGSTDLNTGNDSRVVEGYPLFGRWAYPILGWADQNSDGMIDPLEVVLGDSLEYVGPTEPRYTGYIANQIGFLNNRVLISANFAYADGMTQFNQNRQKAAQYTAALQGVDSEPNEQACVAASDRRLIGYQSTDWCFMETFTILRLQDLAVSYNVPPSLAQRFGATSATISLSTNNLTYWTNYKGGDPGVNTSPVTGNAAVAGPAFGAPREYGVRVRLTF